MKIFLGGWGGKISIDKNSKTSFDASQKERACANGSSLSSLRRVVYQSNHSYLNYWKIKIMLVKNIFVMNLLDVANVLKSDTFKQILPDLCYARG